VETNKLEADQLLEDHDVARLLVTTQFESVAAASLRICPLLTFFML